MQLDTLRARLEQRPRTAGDDSAPPVLVIGSGKGGVGTSTIATLIALVGAARGTRVLLVDADSSLASLHLLLNAPAGPGIGALRGAGAEPHELVIPLSETLSLLPGAGADDRLTSVERRTLFRRIATLYLSFDAVVVDGGSRLESVLAACGGGVRRVLAVTDSGRVSIAGSYALIKVLRREKPEVPVELLVNHVEPAVARQVASEVAEAARHFLGAEVGCVGSVPDDHCLSAGIRAGMSLQEAAAGSPAANAIQTITTAVLNQLTTAAPAGAGRQPSRRI